MPFPPITFLTPTAGTAMSDVDVDAIPPNGAARLENLAVDNGLARSRQGFSAFLNTPNANRVIDILNIEFADRSVEAIRCSRTTSFRADYAANPNVWAQINQAAATPVVWTGADNDRFWGVLAPWTGEAKGRIVIGNGVDVVKSWTGGANFMTSIGGSAVAAKYGLVGPDARLFVAYTTEGGSARTQRVRWTVIGDASDWAGVGSGFIDIKAGTWPITALWLQHGRIYVGFSRAIAVLDPTGLATDAYGASVLVKDGTGPLGGLIQYDNNIAFLAGGGFKVFNGTTAQDIGPHLSKTLLERLNYGALDQITRYHDEARARVGWGLPLDNASTPTEIWWFHYNENRWEVDTLTHTALAAVTTTDTTSYDELAGTFDALAGTFDALSSSASARPVLVVGKNDGTTSQRDATAATDVGAAIPNLYISGAGRVLGLEGIIAGQRHAIDSDDFLVADKIEIDLLDRGSNYTIKADVSGDGGQTWTEMGQPTLVTAAAESARRRVTTKVYGRIPLKDRIQIRLTQVTAGAKWGWGKVSAWVDVIGRKP